MEEKKLKNRTVSNLMAQFEFYIIIHVLAKSIVEHTIIFHMQLMLLNVLNRLSLGNLGSQICFSHVR